MSKAYLGLKKTGMTHQRMWDLIRYQRQELHTAGLITDDEYGELAQDHPAVKRLEDYDKLAARLTELAQLVREALVAEHAPKADWQKRAGKALSGE